MLIYGSTYSPFLLLLLVLLANQCTMRLSATVLVVVALLAVSVVDASSTEADYVKIFTQYIAKFRKSYAASAFAAKLAVFRRNLDRITTLNGSANRTYTLAPTQFSDMTTAEFIAKYTGDNGSTASFLEADSEAENGMRHFNAAEQSAEAMQENFQKGFDWRTTPGVLRTVRHQGPCGSCWAHTSTSTVEALLAIKGSPAADYISPAALTECACGGCRGGAYSCAFGALKKSGYYLESQKPYNSASIGKCDKKLPAPVGKIRAFSHAAGNDNNFLALISINPAYIALYAGEALQHYREGIILPNACKGESPNHAVTAVGYSTQRLGDNFINYYIIRNSWGEQWVRVNAFVYS